MKVLVQTTGFALFLMSMVSSAGELPNPYTLQRGMEFDWEKLCTSVKPVSFQGCDTVHPTTPLLRNWGDPSRSLENNPENARRWALDCDSAKRSFKRYTTKGFVVDNPWLHCRSVFLGNYASRYENYTNVKAGKTVPHYEQDLVSWYEQYMKPYLR
jgi:hypothetical protein